MSDLTLAIRRLAQQPTFTVTAALTLALGIGLTTAVFSVIDAVLLRPLPFREPGRLVELARVSRGGSFLTSHPLDAMLEWRRQTDLFAAFEAYRPQGLVLVDGSEPVRVEAMAVTGGLIPMLGVGPALGRPIIE